MSTVWRILAFVRPRASLALGALACVAVVSTTTVGFAFLAGPAVAAIGAPSGRVPEGLPEGLGRGDLLIALAAGLLAITLVRALAAYGRAMLVARLGEGVVRDLRQRMYEHLLHAAPRSWTERRHGELASRLSHDAMRVQVLVSSQVVAIASAVLTFGALASFAFTLDPVLAAVALGALPPIGVLLWLLGRRVRRAHREAHARHADLAARGAELAHTAPVIAAYGAEATAAAEFAERNAALEREILAATRWSALAVPVAQVLGAVAILGALVLAAGRLMDGSLGATPFVSFFATLVLMYRPVQTLGSVSQQIATGLGALDRVDEVLTLPRQDLEPEGAVELPRMSRGLSLRGIRFGYRPDEPVLDGIDLAVSPGESIAIAGSSGQGKTTLLSVMLGLLHPDAGQVSIDGVPVGEASPRSWRAQFAWVTQEPLVFADSLLANVALADPAPDRARAEEALRRAGAGPLLDTLGLDHELAEGGRDLSGGQRQRVCIARALYRDAPILLFDEATSSLDGPAERAIARTIEELMSERTVVVVSHRLSTVQRARRVVVIEAGRVVESGSPRSLWETGGRFHELFRDAAPT